MEQHVVASFLYPFRPVGRRSRWLLGTALVALLPVTFPLVFGYAILCVRTSACDASAPPPLLRPSRRMLTDGLWSAAQAALLTAPFATAAAVLAGAVERVWRPTGSAFPDVPLAWIVALTAAALPWGLLMLVVLPPTLASFAVSGRPGDLAAIQRIAACVRERYAEWNVVVAGITTAWALAAAGLALLVLGVVPGVFYAILVSAHACSAFAPNRTPR